MQLSGNLRNFSLPELLHVMASGQKSGRLSLATSAGPAAIIFENGAVVHAEVEGRVGEEAVFAIFRFTEGDFSFSGGVRASKKTVFFDHTTLMLEAARLHDEGLEVTAHDLGVAEGHFAAIMASDGDARDELLSHRAALGAQLSVEEEREVSFHPHLLEAVGNLSERLESCAELAGYVVYSRDGLLKSGERPKARSVLSPPEPKPMAQAFDAAEELGETLGAGKLALVAISAPGGERVMLFQISGLMAMAWPAKGAKPLELLSRVTALSALPSVDGALVALR